MKNEAGIKWNTEGNYGAGDQKEMAEEQVKKVAGEAKIRLGLVAEASPAEIKAESDRIFGIMNDLWTNGKMATYEQSLSDPIEVDKYLLDIDATISAIEGSNDMIEIGGMSIPETLKKLVKMRDFIKLSIHRG